MERRISEQAKTSSEGAGRRMVSSAPCLTDHKGVTDVDRPTERSKTATMSRDTETNTAATEDQGNLLSCVLLTIPQELWDCIYSYLLVSPSFVIEILKYLPGEYSKEKDEHGLRYPGVEFQHLDIDDSGADSAVSAYVALSATCRQLYHAVKGCFLKCNIFAACALSGRSGLNADPILPLCDDDLMRITRIVLYRYTLATRSDRISVPAGLALTFDGPTVRAQVACGRDTMAEAVLRICPGDKPVTLLREPAEEEASERIQPAVEELRQMMQAEGKLTRRVMDRLREAVFKAWFVYRNKMSKAFNMEEPATTRLDNGPTSRLFTIPRELRDCIYEHLVVATDRLFELPQDEVSEEQERQRVMTTHTVGHDHRDTASSYRALSLTCRKLHEESKATFFRHNMFGAWVDESRSLLPQVVDSLANVRRLLLCRYNAHEYPKSYPPCILDLTFTGCTVHAEVFTAPRSKDNAQSDLADWVQSVCRDHKEALTAQKHLPGGPKQRITVALEDLKERLKSDGKLTREILDDLTAALVEAW
ncbi:hypothetical protein LTR85_010663 [Meristemomyces frigidus]|nr:hypothetical protein LTR85_010663 [Meristemomyces frigidus]